MSRSKRLEATDFVIIALSPLLIMGMLITLSYFLVEILYRGQYQGQLLYALTWFVMAIVLITRISLEGNRAGAWFYALLLAFVTMLIILRFVEIPKDGPLGPFGQFLPFIIMALIWWSADRLTKDCTHSGDENEAGLLDFNLIPRQPLGVIKDPNAAPEPTSQAGTRPKDKSAFLKEYEKEREEERRHHRPGTWVIYFSLAALPLFGLGQALIPAHDVERRRYTFWLLTIYVGCGLGLLLSTCFLGLRRYLRHRQMNMPGRMTGTFLTVGAGIIMAMLFVAAWLPRPGGEVGLSTMVDLNQWFKKDKKEASQHALIPGGGGEGDGSEGGTGETDQMRQGQRGSPDPNQNDPNQPSGKQGQGGQGSSSSSSGGGSPHGSSSDGQSKGENRGEKGRSSDRRPGQKDHEEGDADDDEEKAKMQGSPVNQQDPEGTGTGGRRRQVEQDDRSSKSPPSPNISSSSKIAVVITWLLLALVIVVGLYFLVKNRHGVMAWLQGLTRQFRDWWNWLWMDKTKEPQAPMAQMAADVIEKPIPPPPFHTFRNPFDHEGDFRSQADIIRYSLAALHSWAYEQNLGRKVDETVLEFTQRLGVDRPAVKKNSYALAQAYVWITYAKGKVKPQHIEAARAFWQSLPPLRPRSREAVASA